MNDPIYETMLRAWCEYREMKYVKGRVNPLPSDDFEKGFYAGLIAYPKLMKGGEE